MTVPSRVESVRLASAFIVQAARNMRVPPASDSLFELAIVEALNNAVKHGNPGQRPEALIICEVELVEHRLTVRILDQGPGFALPRPVQAEWAADDVGGDPGERVRHADHPGRVPDGPRDRVARPLRARDGADVLIAGAAGAAAAAT